MENFFENGRGSQAIEVLDEVEVRLSSIEVILSGNLT